MNILKKSKLITTIGPASEGKETMKKLFEAGMTTIRLNFSHGDHEEQGARIDTARSLMNEMNAPISVMLDTKGPEIRVGRMIGGKREVKTGQKITIYTDEKSYKEKECAIGEMTVSYDMSKDLKAGKVILVDDGKLQLTVDKVSKGLIEATAINHHVVKTNKRINLPGTKFSMPFLAEKDINDIKFGIEKGVDYIAASFVNTPEDIKQIRKLLKDGNAEHIQIISKIESQFAVDNFDAIAKETDGVMVARGDLGLEIPYYEVPTVQKSIIRKMRELGKPVIVATQMLDSMESNPHPTRAEVTDVYWATELGADATMLSGESAAGDYPVQTVNVMAQINFQAEKEFYKKTYYDQYLKQMDKKGSDERTQRAIEITQKAKEGNYRFIVVRSKSGKLLHEIARLRPNANILGVVEKDDLTTQYGITSSIFVYTDCSIYLKIRDDHKNASPVVEEFGGKKGDKYLVVDQHGFTDLTL